MPCKLEELTERLIDVRRVLEIICVTPFRITALLPSPLVRVDCVMQVGDDDIEEILRGLETAKSILECLERRFANYKVRGFFQVTDGKEFGPAPVEPDEEFGRRLYVQAAFFVAPQGVEIMREAPDIQRYLEAVASALEEEEKQHGEGEPEGTGQEREH